MSHISTVKTSTIATLARGLAAAALALGLGQAQAGLIVSDLGGGVTRATIDNLTLNVTQSGTAGFLIVEDFWAVTSSVCGLGVSSTMIYSINGGAAITPQQYNCTGRFSSNFQGFDTNDLAFDFNDGGDAFTAGTTVTFNGSFTFSGNTLGIAANPGPYLVTLNGQSGVLASSRIDTGAASAVPEPTALGLVGAALAALALTRRRRSV